MQGNVVAIMVLHPVVASKTEETRGGKDQGKALGRYAQGPTGGAHADQVSTLQ